MRTGIVRSNEEISKVKQNRGIAFQHVPILYFFENNDLTKRN